MSTLLAQTLEERAGDGPSPYLDVATLEAAGRQRIRRRRLAGGAGALAFVVALGVAAPYVVDRAAGDDRGQVATEPEPFTGQVSWGDGSEIRVGDRTVDVGVGVRSYVLTTSGVVVTDRSGVVRFADGVGEPVEIGSTQEDYGTLLVADGDLVAWYDEGTGEFVAYDTAVGEVTRTITVPPDEPGVPREFQIPTVLDLDGTDLLFFADQQATRLDLTTGEQTFSTPAENSQLFDEAANGRVAESIGGPEAEAADQRVWVFDPALPGYVGEPVPGEGRAGLSPDATYVVTDPEDSEQVWEVASGDDVTPQLPDNYGYQVVVRWLSPDTYQALAFTDESLASGSDAGLEPDVLTCSVVSGTCEVIATDVADLDQLTLPTGVAQDL